VTTTEDRKLRQVMQETLQSVPPSPVPLEVIIRRGRGIRLRRAGAAVCGLALAGIVAGAALALQGSSRPANPATVPLGPVVPGGVIARGTADGHPWRLAAQDIADPGHGCLPAIVLNGTDADPVHPDPLSGGVVALGSAVPGIGFAFIQLPAQSNGIVVDGHQNIPAVTVAACGYRYHLAGFAYSLAKVLRITMSHTLPSQPTVLTLPFVTTKAPGSLTSPQTAGLWINPGSVSGEAASGVLASGHVSGQSWTIKLLFGTGGDCYAFSAAGSLGSNSMGSCGPVSTPDGPETIMALPLGFPASGTGATGYAVQVSPGTARLKAVLSNGSVTLATPRVIDGRKYVAFVVPSPLTLSRLVWLDAGSRVIASTAAAPLYGYVQFQP
jgi:hypothetical protein